MQKYTIFATLANKSYKKSETPSPRGGDVPISIGISFFKVKRLYSG